MSTLMPALSELAAGLPPGRDDHPPRLVMGLHKSGSTMLEQMMGRALAGLDWPTLNLPGQMWRRGIGIADWLADPACRALFRPGLVYTGFRVMPGFMDRAFLEPCRIVLLVRDPRDALVSAFFSVGPGGSHVLPPTANLRAEIAHRSRLEAGLDIDAWVLQREPGFRRNFLAYAARRDLAGMRIWRYEDVLFDKAGFLGQSLAHLNLPVDPALIGRVVAAEPPLPQVEDPSKHLRKGLPGDHRVKLRPETIASLNDRLAEVLEIYGYPRD
jgi:hypothetical protein